MFGVCPTPNVIGCVSRFEDPRKERTESCDAKTEFLSRLGKRQCGDRNFLYTKIRKTKKNVVQCSSEKVVHGGTEKTRRKSEGINCVKYHLDEVRKLSF